MAAHFQVEGGEVVVVPTVQGLSSEALRVRAAYDAHAPAAIALGVSPESVEALASYTRDPEEDPFDELPEHDYVYSEALRAWGEVDLPPPDLVEALRLAKEHGLAFAGVDMPEEAYEDLFTKEVSAVSFLLHGRRQRKLARRPPRAEDATAFSLAWDAEMRRTKAIGRVEAARERHIAQGARDLAAKVRGRVLLVVDVPRAAGVKAALAAAG